MVAKINPRILLQEIEGNNNNNDNNNNNNNNYWKTFREDYYIAYE